MSLFAKASRMLQELHCKLHLLLMQMRDKDIGIVIKFLQCFCNLVLNDSYFPVITEAQEKAKMFENGSCFFYVLALKVVNNFSALQSFASKLILIIPFESLKSENRRTKQETLSIYH